MIRRGSIWALPPPNWTGTSRGSIWALLPPNWDQQGSIWALPPPGGTSPTKQGINLGTSPTKLEPAGDQSGHQQGINLGTSPIRAIPPNWDPSTESIWALPPPNWDHKLGPAGDQSGHFPHQTAGDQSGRFPHQTGTSSGSIWAPAQDQSGPPPGQSTSRGSIWALPPPNWDQQGTNMGTSPTKLKPAGDQSGHFPHQTGTSRGSIWDQGQGINLASPTKLGPAGLDQSGRGINMGTSQLTSRGSIWALPPPNWTGTSRGSIWAPNWTSRSIWALPPPNWTSRDQSWHFSHQTGTSRDQSEHFPHQTGPAGINLGTSPTKLKRGSMALPPNKGSIWALLTTAEAPPAAASFLQPRADLKAAPGKERKAERFPTARNSATNTSPSPPLPPPSSMLQTVTRAKLLRPRQLFSKRCVTHKLAAFVYKRNIEIGGEGGTRRSSRLVNRSRLP